MPLICFIIEEDRVFFYMLTISMETTSRSNLPATPIVGDVVEKCAWVCEHKSEREGARPRPHVCIARGPVRLCARSVRGREGVGEGLHTRRAKDGWWWRQEFVKSETRLPSAQSSTDETCVKYLMTSLR